MEVPKVTGSLIMLGLLASIFGASVTQIVLSNMRPADPIISIIPTVINSPMKVGTQPIIEFKTTRRAICRAESDNFIMLKPMNRVVWRQRIQGISSREGFQRSETPIGPDNLPPGNYCYRSFVYSDCDGRLSTYPEPDACFEVIL